MAALGLQEDEGLPLKQLAPGSEGSTDYSSKVRALHYPWKLRVMNSKHSDSITAVLAEQIDDNDCFRLLPSDLAMRFPVESPGHHCYSSLFTQKTYPGGDLNAPTFRLTTKKATRGSTTALGKNWPWQSCSERKII